MNNLNGPAWRVVEWSGSAEEFHSRDVTGPRTVWLCTVTSPALVLGSSQSESDINRERAAKAGVQIVRRRTGGGAVFLHPTDSIWIDVTIDRDDPLWTDDVSDSMIWLGRAFVDALSPWISASVRTDRFDAGPDGKTVCFASAAPGEVFVGDRKLVGISQRRGRWGARFQCVLYRSWNPENWCSVLTDGTAPQRVSSLPVAVIGATGREVLAALVETLSR